MLKFINDNLMEFVNTMDSYASEINRFPAKDFPAFLDSHYNGGLGYMEMGVETYNKIPTSFKRNTAYKLSKVNPWKAGKIFQNSKGFMTEAGKAVGKFGKISTVLSTTAGAVDLLEDGNVKTSTAVNMGLLAVGLAFPATAPFILAYGVLD